MDKFVIHGGKPLFGEVTISGAKNAAVAIIPAAILVDGVCRIENIPMVRDVVIQMEILRELGVGVRVVQQNTIEIDCHFFNISAVFQKTVQLFSSVPSKQLSKSLPLAVSAAHTGTKPAVCGSSL